MSNKKFLINLLSFLLILTIVPNTVALAQTDSLQETVLEDTAIALQEEQAEDLPEEADGLKDPLDGDSANDLEEKDEQQNDVSPQASNEEMGELVEENPDLSQDTLSETMEEQQETSIVEIPDEHVGDSSDLLVNDTPAPMLMNAPILRTSGEGLIYVSAAGNDTTGDGSEENPYASLTKAYDVSMEGNTIVLLSNVSLNSCVSVWHSLTIKSKDGEGPYVVTRAAGFAPSFDRARQSYHPGMFELHSDNSPATLTFENIVLDDASRAEGTQYSDPNTSGTGGNNNKVHDAIVAVYEDPAHANPGTVVLGSNTTLQNYGGLCAVFVSGSTSKLVMQSGSLITNNGQSSKAYAAVYNGRATFEMQQGATITKATGTIGSALLSNYATNFIDGTISNCKGSSGDYAIINLRGGETEVGSNADISYNTTKHGTIYAFIGAKLTVRGEIHHNITDAETTWSSGIYASDNGAPAQVFIEDGAYIHHNQTYQYPYWFFTIDSPYVAAVLANNTASVTMNGGRIVDNDTPFGVMVRKNGRFIMNGGEISGNQTGINIENYQSEIQTGRVVLNGGTLTGNQIDLAIVDSERGHLDGSFVLLGSNASDQPIKVSFTVVEMLLGRLPIHQVQHSISPTFPEHELLLGHATAAGENALKSVPETGGTILADWYGFSENDTFSMSVMDITVDHNQNYYICMIPVDENGIPIDANDYHIFQCEIDNVSDHTGVKMDFQGTGNGDGYVFGLFTSPALPNETYTLRYETYGGTSYENKTGIAFHEVNLLPERDPEKEGTRFIGWFCDESFTRECTNETSYAQIVGNEVTIKEATIYAQYEPLSYTVSFDSDGGSAVEPQTVEHGKQASKPADPTKKGHTFLGWYLNEQLYEFETPVTTDFTLTAKWKKTIHELRFCLNGGAYSGDTSDVVYYMEYGSNLTIPKAPEREGYTFLRWEGSAYYPGDNYLVEGDHVFTAQWEEKPKTVYELRFCLNGGEYSGSTADLVYHLEDGSNLIIPAAPEREGYTFLYWEGSVYYPGDNYLVEGDHVFTAQWKENSAVVQPKRATPNTGDSGNLPLWLFVLSTTGILFSFWRKKRKTTDN